LPVTTVQPPHILTGPSSILDIDHVKEQPSRASQIMRYGYPGFDNLRTFEDYVLSYDRRNRIAHWVVEHLSAEKLVYNSSNSGYDRGHLAAAGNHRQSQNAIDQTFLLSNMAPQVGKGFNRGKWNELEKHIRKLARKQKNVYVCTGPLFLPKLEKDGSLFIKYKVVGRNNIAVPTHFFKVVLVELMDGKFELEAYILPNTVIPDDTPLNSFMVPLDSIERSAGFLIFDKLPKGALQKINGKSNNMLW
uniref:Endonuclease n=1 Tax=Loa loa TaxID=7209 RepID=A0A1I7VHG7_LOALO